jgi:hypothetical protein
MISPFNLNPLAITLEFLYRTTITHEESSLIVPHSIKYNVSYIISLCLDHNVMGSKDLPEEVLKDRNSRTQLNILSNENIISFSFLLDF